MQSISTQGGAVSRLLSLRGVKDKLSIRKEGWEFVLLVNATD